ncbi:MAG: SseB family protein [Actinomycetaceae bacterium]|nr:SseB family protein [Actinomycetaceae bacterium]
MDLDRLLRPNPFAGDTGQMSEPMRRAMDLPERGPRLKAIVAAIADGRLLVPALAHEHPGRAEDGSVADHASEPDPTGDAVAAASTLSVRIPGGRFATPVFSCVERLAACYPQARPIPVLGRNVAAQALLSNGTLALDPHDPSGRGAIAVARGAVAAIAAGETWRAPWEDLGILAEFERALAQAGQRAKLAFRVTANGILRLIVEIPAGLDDRAAYSVVETVVQAAEGSAGLRTHLDIVEIVPVSANSQGPVAG